MWQKTFQLLLLFIIFTVITIFGFSAYGYACLIGRHSCSGFLIKESFVNELLRNTWLILGGGNNMVY